MAFCPAAIGRPVRGGALSAHQGLAALALPPDHLLAEPSCLLLPGLPVGEGERSQGRPEGGAGAGGGASQQLSGHDGSVSNRAGNGGVPVGEHQPAGHRRYQSEILNYGLFLCELNYLKQIFFGVGQSRQYEGITLSSGNL